MTQQLNHLYTFKWQDTPTSDHSSVVDWIIAHRKRKRSTILFLYTARPSLAYGLRSTATVALCSSRTMSSLKPETKTPLISCTERDVLNAGRVSELPAIEKAKRLAAFAAVDAYIKPEHKIIGIGSGSTVPYVVERIAMQGKEMNKDRVFVPTGVFSPRILSSEGATLTMQVL